MTVEPKPGAMTHHERIQAALRGEPVDRTPISLWRHYPGRDETAQALAQSTLEFQRQFDSDLVKLMPTGMYSVMDYGVKVRLVLDDGIGSTRFVASPVREPADWARLPAVSPQSPALKEALDTVSLVRAGVGPDVPILQTIFSPMAMAAKVVGGNLSDPIANHEGLLCRALEKMADDVIAFGRACLEAGADGFFFATQQANRTTLAEGAYQRLGVPYDLKVLEALRSGAWCNVLHLHGMEPLFELADLYPVDAVNWHDRETAPTLAEALGQTKRCLVGGLARSGISAKGTAEEAAAQVPDAVAQTGGRRLILAPGCVINLSVPDANLAALRRAVEPAGS